jgi:AbrB family looped-hinge helix DNA binding protein
MVRAHSKVTSRCRTTIPADIRKKLGIEPGSVLLWNDEEGRIVVHGLGGFTSQAVHDAVFPKQRPKPRSLDELRTGITQHMNAKHRASLREHIRSQQLQIVKLFGTIELEGPRALKTQRRRR